MTDFKHKGFTYELITKILGKGKVTRETIRWKNGFRNFWERISLKEYEEAKIESTHLKNMIKQTKNQQKFVVTKDEFMRPYRATLDANEILAGNLKKSGRTEEINDFLQEVNEDLD
jgi:Icc-related predicted phosphoesterase